MDRIGRNRNFNDTATVTKYSVDAVSAITISPPNDGRMCFIVSLDVTSSNIDVFIRLYAAATDNSKTGILLNARTSGNDALFNSVWVMPTDNIYTGEISAISNAGSFDIHVTEF